MASTKLRVSLFAVAIGPRGRRRCAAGRPSKREVSYEQAERLRSAIDRGLAVWSTAYPATLVPFITGSSRSDRDGHWGGGRR